MFPEPSGVVVHRASWLCLSTAIFQPVQRVETMSLYSASEGATVRSTLGVELGVGPTGSEPRRCVRLCLFKWPAVVKPLPPWHTYGVSPVWDRM